ncbi:MAG TPA: hypothetical protein VFP05_17750 [Thermomicrobiales bacterium]|jgi:flagellar biosynthesis/type III secretory pathway M-ring protein FliF/YscJ|nr:hypothetical protein [Thermomicrobiales bacterium]
MSNWWIVVIVIIFLVAIGLFAIRARREGQDAQAKAHAAANRSDRNYEQEREDSRVSHLSDEDRAWEAASLQKNREAQQQSPPPTTEI